MHFGKPSNQTVAFGLSDTLATSGNSLVFGCDETQVALKPNQ